MKQYGAEFIGTFWLVLGGCGSAVLAAAFPGLGIGLLGVALAFGLTVLTMAFAIGHISGCHLNPAVSIGLWAGGRFPAGKLLPYIVAQLLGGLLAGGILYLIASGKAGFDVVGSGFAANGYGEHSPGGYSMVSGLVAEVVLTFMFLMVILGSTDPARARRLRADRHRAGPDAHPPHRHPRHQHVGEPGAQHRSGALRRRLGAGAALVVLGRAAGRWSARGGGLPAGRGPEGVTGAAAPGRGSPRRRAGRWRAE